MPGARRTGRAAEQSRLPRGSAGSPPMPVALTATALRGVSSESRGVVLVIEDLSELLAAQRAAAWSEVAKRIAHEIKNPLTPIQLSAERIARNFHVRLNGSEPGADRGARGGPPGLMDATSYVKLLDNEQGPTNGNDGNGSAAPALTEDNREELERVGEECT